MGAHILENVVIRTWRMRATTPQENRSGRCNKRKQSDEHSDSISHRKNNEEKEGEKEERERHQQEEEQKSAILLKAALFYVCKEKIELNNRKKGR